MIGIGPCQGNSVYYISSLVFTVDISALKSLSSSEKNMCNVI